MMISVPENCSGQNDVNDPLNQLRAGRVPPTLIAIRQWADELADYGWPHFGEFAQRLEAARGELVRHLVSSPEGSPEGSRQDEPSVQSLESGCSAEVQELLEEFDQFINQLRCADVCFVSWQAACRRFDEVCQICQQLPLAER